MVLYNIHTHFHSISQINNYNIRYIVNTYPLEFENLKRQQPTAKVFSCGIHPWYSQNTDAQFYRLKELLSEGNNIVAVGEIGLDKLKGPGMDTQIDVFRRQAELAEEMHKPVIIHCVKAWQEIVMLKKEINPEQVWIVHGFRGGVELVKQLIDHDFRFSIGKSFNAEAVKIIPSGSLYLETDDADMSIVIIYNEIAGLLGLSVAELVVLINNNVRNTFKLTENSIR